MSGFLCGLVWKSDLPREQKYILLALADHGQDDGSAIYPSIRKTALKVGLSERTVYRHLQAFIKSGLLEVVQKSSHHSFTRYRIVIDKLSYIPELCMAKRGDTHDTPGRQRGVTPVTKRGDTHDNSGVTPVTNAIERARDTLETSLETSINSLSQSLSSAITESERENCIQDLKRIFPTLLSIPDEIPIERAYLFLHKIRIGEIKRENIYSPVAFMLKMRDEDISGPLQKDRDRKATAALRR